MKHARHELWSSAEVSRLVSLLSSEREYLESILNVLPTPIAVLTEDLTIEAGNDAFWEATGLKRHSGLRRSVSEVTGDQAAAQGIRTALDEARSSVAIGGQNFLVARIPAADEILLAGQSSAPGPMFPSREQKLHHELFLEGPDPLFVLDGQGTITDANVAAEAFTGASTLKGKLLSDLATSEGAAVTVPDLRARCGQPVQAALAGRTVEMVARELSSGSIAISARDITERVENEQHGRFGERMLAVSRLAGGVSHELNNILTVVTSYCHIALEQLNNGPGTEEVEAILKAAGDATQLGNQLVSLGRKHAFHDGLTDLNGALIGLERTLRAVCGETTRLDITTEPNLPPIYADPRQLDRALIAFVLHARDAAGDGGQITIRSGRVDRSGKLPASLLPGTDYVSLVISDTRRWPAEAVGLQALEPYMPYPGTKRNAGLDLAVAYSIVRQCRGEVDVRSDSTGTVATLYFPLRQVAASVEKAAAPPRKEATVLLVDDNVEIRNAIRHMLERQGYEVLEAAGPDQALDVIENSGSLLDILLSDVNMPDMSGRELADRARVCRPGIKVLLMSGYADEEIDVGELDDTVVFLQKPFSPERLLKTVRGLLQAGVQ